jgi:hypothetical protein
LAAIYGKRLLLVIFNVLTNFFSYDLLFNSIHKFNISNISNKKTDAINLSECDLTLLKTAMSEFIDSNFYKKNCDGRLFANLTAIQNVPFALTSDVTIPVASIIETKADFPTVANKKTAAANKKISKGKTMAVVPKTIPLKKIIKNGKRSKCTDSDESNSTSTAKVEEIPKTIPLKKIIKNGKRSKCTDSDESNSTSAAKVGGKKVSSIKKANKKLDEPSIKPPIVVEDTKSFQHILEFVKIIEEDLAHSKY